MFVNGVLDMIVNMLVVVGIGLVVVGVVRLVRVIDVLMIVLDMIITFVMDCVLVALRKQTSFIPLPPMKVRLCFGYASYI